MGLGLGLLAPGRVGLGSGVGSGPGLAVPGPAPGTRAAPAAGLAASSVSRAGGRAGYIQWVEYASTM